MCEFSRVFEHVKAPKNPWTVERKKKNKKKIIILRRTRGPCALLAWALIKAASSDERDLAPGLTANGGFRKTGSGEQYAFKEENIEGIYQNHLYVPNFLLPAGGAMTISGYWHVDIFRKAL